MKLHGYCTECRRIKRVNVSGAGMAALAAKGVAQGVCDYCASPKPPSASRRGTRPDSPPRKDW